MYSVSLFSADISTSELISRWRPIDKTLHYNFSATTDVFQKSVQLFIRRTRVLSSNGCKKKRNLVFSKITAIGATLHTFLDLSVLITELLPTLGYPIKPTLQETAQLQYCSQKHTMWMHECILYLFTLLFIHF